MTDYELYTFVGHYIGTNGTEVAVTDSRATAFADVEEEPDFEPGDLVILVAIDMDGEGWFKAVSLELAEPDTPMT